MSSEARLTVSDATGDVGQVRLTVSDATGDVGQAHLTVSRAIAMREWRG